MDCCTPTSQPVEVEEALLADPLNAPAAKGDDPRQSCTTCRRGSRPVTRKTVLLMLRPELIEQASEGEYRFCAQSDCETVYFNERSGESFTTSDLRVRVGLKERTDPIPLCYCFGFDEKGMREEIFQTGKTTIPDRIKALIKEKMCACPARNPSGACCLGEVLQSAKRLGQETRVPLEG